MTRKILHVFLLGLLLCFWNCKRKTDIKITIFNPYIQAYVKDAKISIVEFHTAGKFSGCYGCRYDKANTIADGSTDENGEVVFDDLKMKWNENYEYGFRINEIWGSDKVDYDYGTYDRFQKGKTNSLVKCDYTKGASNIHITNLFIPGASGDSLILIPEWYDLYDPQQQTWIKSEGMQKIQLAFDDDANLRGDVNIANGSLAAGKVKLTVRKRKMSSVTVDTFSVQFYPKQTTNVIINW
jgi:hypothetical protein